MSEFKWIKSTKENFPAGEIVLVKFHDYGIPVTALAKIDTESYKDEDEEDSTYRWLDISLLGDIGGFDSSFNEVDYWAKITNTQDGKIIWKIK